MSWRYAILGAGRQGTAAAWGLGKFGEAESVTLADVEEDVARAASARVNKLLGREIAKPARLDATDPVTTRALLHGHHACLSCVPYFLNEDIARVAVDARVHFCDLGGNTAVVERELALHPEASARGVSLIPDCGLAPGFGNTLGALAIEQLDADIEVHIRCGGLPVHPRPPLDYMMVFSIHGLINEYTGEAEYIRNGKIIGVPTLSELEAIEFAKPVGPCECFVTSGGTSTAPKTWLGRVKTYDYKTVRYPGHFEKFKTLLDLGLLDKEPVTLGPQRVVPRDVVAALLVPRLTFPGDKDLVVLRVSATGTKNGKPLRLRYDILEFGDPETGFTAMERTTAYPAALVAHMMARGETMRGAIPLEKSVPPGPFVERLRGWGIGIQVAD